MSKYTKEELQEMAKAFLGMYNAKVDIRPEQVIQHMAMMFQMHPSVVLQNIQSLADKGEV